MSSYNETDPVPKDLDLTTPTEGATPPAEINNAIREAKRVLKIGSAIITTTGNLQLTEQHSTVLVNGAHTITLPTIANVSSSTFTRRYRIINISASTGVLKTKAGGETLNGNDYSSTGLNLDVQYAEYLIYGNGTVWYMERADELKADTISELTGAAGVTIDGLKIKDNAIDPTSWPSFSAYLSAEQSNITGEDQIEFDTEEFDTNSDFNTTTFRFTPTVAGKYLLTIQLRWKQVTAQDHLTIVLRKNGATFKATVSRAPVTGDNFTSALTSIVDSNGTDYWEVFAFNSERDTSDVESFSSYTYFQGSRIA